MKKYNEDLTFTRTKVSFDHEDQITQPPVIGSIHQLLIQYQANPDQPLFGDDYNEDENGILPTLEYMDQLEVADFLQNFEERRRKTQSFFATHQKQGGGSAPSNGAEPNGVQQVPGASPEDTPTV